MSHHLPHPDGTAAGRALAALRSGLQEHGHAVTVHTWSFDRPPPVLPPDTRWVTVAPGSMPARRARALVRPRTDAARHPWEDELADAELVLADDPVSWPAVERARTAGGLTWRAVATLHYATSLDAAALARRSLRDVQDRRAERAVARTAPRLHAFSSRVAAEARGWRGAAHVATVPIAHDPGPPPPPQIEQPVAALLANWDWPPNRVAADRLLALWPAVRDRVAGAELRLAGRGDLQVGTLPGVDVVGTVADSRDFLAGAAAVVFPCPPSSGPKVKVLEAAATARAVVTSPAGVEGFAEDWPGDATSPGSSGAVVVTGDEVGRWIDAVADVLGDPGRRADLAAAGRRAVEAVHAPAVAAGRRLAELARP